MSTVARSLRALLTNLIDYAGLFPPAGLDMKIAVTNYASYLAGPNAWALGRFVLPVSRFAEFDAAFAHVDPFESWDISALVGQSIESDIAAIEQFNEHHLQAAYVGSMEIKAATPHDIAHLRAFVRGTITPYFEVPPSDPAELIQTIHHIRGRAKIRTGGVTTDAFPSSATIARFVIECAKHNVAFKATAGLHHPVRCVKALTYQPYAPTGTMHGFLNVFLAAVFAEGGATAEQLQALLEDNDPSNFSFEDTVASWREHTFPIEAIGHAREHLAISFGSCSFEEPIGDLKALNLL